MDQAQQGDTGANSWLCRAEIGNAPPQLSGTVPGESRASSLPQGFSSAPKSTSVLMLWGEHCRDRIQGRSKAKGYGEINPEPNTVLQGTSKAATHRLRGRKETQTCQYLHTYTALDIPLAAQRAVGMGRMPEVSMCPKDCTFSSSGWDLSHVTNCFPLQKSAMCLRWKCNGKHRCPETCESYTCINSLEKHHFKSKNKKSPKTNQTKKHPKPKNHKNPLRIMARG